MSRPTKIKKYKVPHVFDKFQDLLEAVFFISSKPGLSENPLWRNNLRKKRTDKAGLGAPIFNSQISVSFSKQARICLPMIFFKALFSFIFFPSNLCPPSSVVKQRIRFSCPKSPAYFLEYHPQAASHIWSSNSGCSPTDVAPAAFDLSCQLRQLAARSSLTRTRTAAPVGASGSFSC